MSYFNKLLQKLNSLSRNPKKLRQSEFYQEENRLHVTELCSISAAFYFLNIPEMSILPLHKTCVPHRLETTNESS